MQANIKDFLEISYENKPCYNIYFKDNFVDLPKLLKEKYASNAVKICVVTDSNVERLYADEVKHKIESEFSEVYTFSFCAGEKYKQLSTVEMLYSFLVENNFHRSDVLVALGGGVVGDLTGFCAATFLRGISFVQVPTTLLSQVDSSVGGKTGVDFNAYKNMVGAFYMPDMVYMNESVLKNLSKEQFSSGMAEVIKYGCIQDQEFYEFLRRHQTEICNAVTGNTKKDAQNAMDSDSKNHISANSNSEDLSCKELIKKVLYTSCYCKKVVVEEDPKEAGIRATLNYGHTLGHAIEKLSDFSLYHGHSVALGMVCAFYIDVQRGVFSEEDLHSFKDMLKSYGLFIDLQEAGVSLDVSQVLSAVKNDKKATSKGVKFIRLQAMGEAVIDTSVSVEEMTAALHYIGCS